MTRQVSVLVLLLASLLGADRWLAGRERARREKDPAIERLVTAERAKSGTVAAITVSSGGRELFYARKNALWRSREAFGAVGSESAVRDLLACFFEAHGVLREEGPQAESYGFRPGEILAVEFHGPKVIDAPDRDVLFSFEVGRSFAEGPYGRCFVREKGSDRVLEIDRDPRRVVDLPASSRLPPLVDTHLLAGSLDAGFRGFREFRVEPAGEDGFRVAIEDPAAEGAAWFLDRGKGREAFPGWRVGGYIGLWLRGRFAETASPSRASDFGLDPPAAIVHIVPDGSEPIELWISRVDDRRRAFAWNRRTNVVMVVPDTWQELLAPSPGMFLDAERANPWETWLSRP